jgi:prepilin-type N-terminal cleavage/methylation domain-containing protein
VRSPTLFKLEVNLQMCQFLLQPVELMKPTFFAKRNSSAGFTLIEVLAVIIIIAILAAVAAPSWLQYMNNQRIGAVKSDLIQALRRAQQEAIKERQTVEVEFRTPNNLGGAENVPAVDSTATGIQLLGEGNIRPDTVFMDVYSFEGQGGTKDDADDQTISFDYQGTVRQENLPFVINIKANPNSNKQQCVIVASLIGTVKTARDAACDNPTVNP